MRDRTKIVYATATPSIFAVKEFAATLDRVCERKGIERHFKHNLVELRPEERTARFVNADTKEEKTLRYDMTHVTPPAGPSYALTPAPTFPLLDATKEQRAFYWLKRYGLPAMYWHGMLRGIA